MLEFVFCQNVFALVTLLIQEVKMYFGAMCVCLCLCCYWKMEQAQEKKNFHY